MSAAAGHQTRVTYLFEDNGFASSPNDTTYKPFGIDASLTTLEGSNNVQRMYGPGSREAELVKETNFSGSWSVEFVLSATKWLAAVISDPSTTSNTDSTTYTYDGEIPETLRIIQGTEATSNERVLKGCVVTDATFSVNTDETVTVTLDGAYADDDTTTGASLQSQVAVQEPPLTFADADVARGGSSLTMTNGEAELSVGVGAELRSALGSRTPTTFRAGARTVDLTHSRIVQDESDLEQLYGNASTSVQENIDSTTDLTITVDNGKSAPANKVVTFNIINALADSGSRDGIGDADSDLTDQLDMVGAGIDASVETGDDYTYA